MNIPDMYTLPTIDFVGGSMQDLAFYVYFHRLSSPFDMSKCSANFSIVDYTNKRGATLLSKAMTIEQGTVVDAEAIRNRLTVRLTSAETVALEGKYIYQISIKENSGRTEVPSQGILYIANNINKGYIS